MRALKAISIGLLIGWTAATILHLVVWAAMCFVFWDNLRFLWDAERMALFIGGLGGLVGALLWLAGTEPKADAQGPSA